MVRRVTSSTSFIPSLTAALRASLQRDSAPMAVSGRLSSSAVARHFEAASPFAPTPMAASRRSLPEGSTWYSAGAPRASEPAFYESQTRKGAHDEYVHAERSCGGAPSGRTHRVGHCRCEARRRQRSLEQSAVRFAALFTFI